ncbi:MAG: glycosyltransferase family 4 protein [Victivallaceae bacterium]|nr:glycosyltransferase family 4 protein [Victivallaceae bacterium]
MSQNKIAIVSIAPGGGWNTVRKRWEKHFGELKDIDVSFYHIEEYARWIHKLTVEKHRLRSLWYLAAGRAAAKQAIKDGCQTILIDTYHYAVWAPLYKNVRYLMYGDATARQLTALRPLETNKNNKLPLFIDWLYQKGVKRLSNHGAIFLGMSNWYLQGLKEECGVLDEQLVELPFGLDVKHWQRRELKPDAAPKKGFEILFIGDPFEEKGGYILRDVAKMPEFSECTFHFIGRTINFKDEGNCRYYNHLKADSSELLQLFSRCDLMALPTYSDFSPNVAIEALAMSMPVIITDVAAISDIVKDGETGRLLSHPPDKEQVRVKLLEYINDPEMLKKESIAARKRAEERFNIDNHMERLYNLLTGRMH